MQQAIALQQSGSAGSQSRNERRGTDRLLERGAPMPEVTPRLVIDGKVRRPDLLFREHGLAVEFDGRAVHGRQRTRNDDRIKEEQLLSLGFHTARVREDHFDEDIDTVCRLLGLPSA